MKQYLELVNDILINGTHRSDRTSTGTRSVFGRQLRFNLQEGFPAVTTKKLAFNACKAELLWFLEGSGDERRLCEITHGTREASKTTIWTANANASYWKPKAEYEGDVGRPYGVQWRNWKNESGQVDQVENLISGIKKDPNGRRHILSAWNVGELDNMALPPCHVMSQFYVTGQGELSCMMTQRSADVLLGTPFNVASYALLTHMVAQVCGLGVSELIISMGDAHIYENHIDQVKEQLSRDTKDLCKLWLNPEITDIDKFTMDDIKLIDYVSHGPISAPMAV